MIIKQHALWLVESGGTHDVGSHHVQLHFPFVRAPVFALLVDLEQRVLWQVLAQPEVVLVTGLGVE